MADLLTPDDLTPFATIATDKAAQMITDAVAMATLSAPCLADPDNLTAIQLAQAKAVLRGAVLRWNEAGTGAVSTQALGPISMTLDTKQPRRQMFWPSEITDLQKICKGGSDGGAFSVDTAAAGPMLFHSVLCGWSGGACTCGAIAFDADYADDAGFV